MSKVKLAVKPVLKQFAVARTELTEMLYLYWNKFNITSK